MQLTLADCGLQGRGLVANERIKSGEAILQVPESLLLTPQTCLQHSRLAPLLADANLPDWSLLALYLVDVDAAAEADIQLPWSAYVAALPRQSGCVLEWMPDQVITSIHSCMVGSGVFQASQFGEAAAPHREGISRPQVKREFLLNPGPLLSPIQTA